MKKIILSTALIVSSLIAAAQYDSLMIDLWGANLICRKQTADDIIDADGRGDESFVQFFFGIVDMKDGTWKKRMINANLDIKLLFDGTNYPLNKPIFSQYPIKDDEILVIVPVAWEQDKGGPDVITAFNNNMNSCLDIIGMQIIQQYNTVKNKYIQGNGYYLGLPSDVIDLGKINWRSFTGLPSFKTLLTPVRGGAGNRPVGMDSNGDYTPAIFSFSRIQLNTMGSPLDAREKERNEFSFDANFNEDALGNTGNHGNYSVILRLQKRRISIGSSPSTGTSPKQVSPIQRPVTLQPDIKNTPVQPVAAFVITGTWQGQWTANNNTLKMKLDDAGFIELYNSNNAVAARGTYSYSNEQFRGKFSLNGNNYELVGTSNKAAGTMNGNWKQTNSITNANGTWNLSKQ